MTARSGSRSAGTAPSRPDDETKWDGAAAGAADHARRAGDDRRDPGRGRRRHAPDGVARRRRGRERRRVSASSGCWYDERARRARLAGSAMRALSPLERYALVDDAWAAVVAGPTTASSFCRFVEGFARRDRTAGVAVDPHRPQLVRSVRRGGAARAVPRVRADPASPVDRPTGVGGIVERRRIWSARSAARSRRRSAVLGDDPEAKAQMRELEGEARAAGTSMPTSPRRRCRWSRRTATRATSSGIGRWSMTASRRRSSSRYLYALARFRDPDAVRSPAGVDAHRRRPPAGRPVPAGDGHDNRDLGDRALAVHRGQLGRRVGSVRIVQHHLAGVGRAVPVVA